MHLSAHHIVHEENQVNSPVLTIRFKLLCAFGFLAAMMIASAALGMVGMHYIDSSTPPYFQTLLRSLVAVALIACAAALGFAAHLHSVVCGGLRRMAGKFEEVAATLDLSKRSASPRMDEFGRAAAAFDGLMRRVEEAMSTVHASTDSVSTSTRQIEAGNRDLSGRTEEQAASLQETAASMMELTESVKRSADHARAADELASDANEIADAGGRVIQVMLDAIERISGSSQKVVEITSVIEGIAFQTNILALNAAVEAARAGEHGRGFAVVASEVRNLAQRCTAAAKEINDVIGASVSTIRASSQHANEVSAAMSEIQSAIRRVSGVVGEIASAADEQHRGIEQINVAVVQMDRATQQNAVLVEQAAGAAHSLARQAVQLKTAVSAFTLAGAVAGH